MTHRDGFPGFSARNVRCRDAGHRKTDMTQTESPGKPPFWSSARPVGGRRKVSTMHRIDSDFSPTRRGAQTISMGYYQCSLVAIRAPYLPRYLLESGASCPRP